MFASDEILKELHILTISDYRQPFGNRHAQAAGMIEVMMGNDYVRQWFCRPQGPGSVDHSLRASFVQWRFEQHKMIVEFKQDASMVSRTGKPPDALAHLFGCNGNRRGGWNTHRSDLGWRGQIFRAGINLIPHHSKIKLRVL